ncbi:DUF1367 family protein [Endozoicomonas sp. YOMI1]|uniref:DUF1367 family protein n=1 Tax=Endozoicomonas sp. YOMI1 TaxID=2828739 RepID=UPI002147E5DA|nr:DUF1367 family protein [Endozoicomonas sp. YOMI1]
MAELALQKVTSHMLMPVSDDDQLFVQQLKTGQVIRAEFRKVRNPHFHRKFFALLKLGFDHFEPQPCRMAGTDQWFTPEKNFDEFRRWVTVKAGFYDVIGYPDGGVRVRARSLKFSSMSQEIFEQLYSAAMDVLLSFVLDPERGWSRAKVDELVERVVNFA